MDQLTLDILTVMAGRIDQQTLYLPIHRFMNEVFFIILQRGPCCDSRLYKDAVFDTNEYPGHRRADAGNIKKSRAFTVLPVIPVEL